MKFSFDGTWITLLRLFLVILLGWLFYRIPASKLPNKSSAINFRVMLFLLIGIYFGFYLVLKFSQFYSFNINAYDFSLYDYALFNSTRGHWFYVPFWQSSFLKEHFSLFLACLVPLYYLWASPINLLIAQSAAVAAAGFPLFAIAKKELQSDWAALAIVFVYLNNWYVVHGLLYEFHVEMFLPLLILLMIWAYMREKQIVFWTTLILALLVKEDVGVYFIPFGLWVAIKGKRVLQGLLTVGLSALTVWLGLTVIAGMNHASLASGEVSGYKFMANWSRYGSGILEVTRYWFFHPMELIGVFINERVNGLQWPLAYIPLFSWWAVLLLIPIALNASSQNWLQAGFMLYYAAPIIPFLFAALVFGLKNLKHALPDRHGWVFSAVLAYIVIFNLHKYIPDRVEPKHHLIRAALQTIPSNSSVAAQGNLVPHLGYRKDISVLAGLFPEKEYVVLYSDPNPYPMTSQTARELTEVLARDMGYALMLDEYGLKIFKKNEKFTHE